MKEGWEVKKLGEITTHLRDGLPGIPNYKYDGDYYFINGNDRKDGIIN